MEFKTLQELCTEIIDCPHTTPEWKTEGIPVIRNYNLQNGFIDKSKLSFVDNDTYLQRIKRGMPQVDDIIFSREAPVGSVAIMPSNFRCCLGQRLVLLKVNKSICDPHYLLYVMLSNFVKKQYKTVEKTGSIVSNFNIGDLKNLVIPYVDIAIQKKIGKMCGMLDRKIAVNNLTIENLESMAKTLHDYWFVQFDFPDANGRPYKTSGGKMEWNETLSREIPAGWEAKKLGDICETRLGGTPDTNNGDYWGGDIPWLNSGEVAISPILSSEKKITDLGRDSSATSTADPGDVLMSITRYIRPSILGISACYNQSVVAVLQNERYKTSFIYPFLLSQVERYMGLRIGAQQPHINKKIVDSTLVINPSKSILDKYYVKVDKVYRQIINIAKENKKLIELRDFILPILMNGQVTFHQ